MREQNSMIFQLHLHFLDLSSINFRTETCHVLFRSLIHTDWILFSILLIHYFAQLRSKTATMRAEFNDFPTSSAFFLDLSGSILGLKHVLFRSLIHTDWILFSILLGRYFAQFRSETGIESKI